MTSQHDIFIHSGHSEGALMADVAMASGGRLRPVAQGPVNYSANLIDTALELQLAHDFEEDKGIPFERYQAVVTVRNFAGNKDRERATADRVSDGTADQAKVAQCVKFSVGVRQSESLTCNYSSFGGTALS